MKPYLITLLLMSVITFFAFLIDKAKSKKDDSRRIPEAVLLSMIGFGGAVGGLVGMYTLRHKTIFKTKYHFIITVWLAAAVQAAILIYILVGAK